MIAEKVATQVQTQVRAEKLKLKGKVELQLLNKMLDTTTKTAKDGQKSQAKSADDAHKTQANFVNKQVKTVAKLAKDLLGGGSPVPPFASPAAGEVASPASGELQDGKVALPASDEVEVEVKVAPLVEDNDGRDNRSNGRYIRSNRRYKHINRYNDRYNGGNRYDGRNGNWSRVTGQENPHPATLDGNRPGGQAQPGRIQLCGHSFQALPRGLWRKCPHRSR
jgi:hypothetical protein